MSDPKQPRNYSSHQQKIIKRYYDNLDGIALQRLSDLVGELYLAEGKKKEKVWQNVAKTLEKLEVPKSRVEQLMKLQKPEMVAELVKELQAKS
jgi:hypothetical protein